MIVWRFSNRIPALLAFKCPKRGSIYKPNPLDVFIVGDLDDEWNERAQWLKEQEPVPQFRMFWYNPYHQAQRNGRTVYVPANSSGATVYRFQSKKAAALFKLFHHKS